MPIRNIGSVRQSVEINLNKCVNFNQSSSIVSYTMPNSIDNTTDITFAMWFYARTVDTTTRRLMEVGNGYSLFLNSSSLQALIGHGTTNAQANTKAGQIKAGVWYRVVVTFTSTDNYPKMYINGIQSEGSNVNKSGSRLSPAGQTAYLGNRAALDRQFDGLIDEHVWYNRLWTDQEIQDDYLRNSQPTDSVQVNFHMDETSGDLVDSSVNAITGAVSNVTQNVTSFTTGTRTTVTNRFIITNTTEKSLSFNGSSSLATSPVVPSLTGFNMSLWARTNSYAAEGKLVNWESAGDRNGFNLRQNGTTGLIAMVVCNASGATANITSSKATTKPLGQWNHIVVTFLPTSLKFYLNNVLIGSDITAEMTSNVNPVTLGRRAFGSGNFYNGNLKDFVFHNTDTPWTTTEIENIYYRRIFPSGINTFNKFDNSTADASGNGNIATLTNTSYSDLVPPHFGTRSTV